MDIAYLRTEVHAWHVLFCKKSYMSYMFVGGVLLYLVALPHMIPHMAS